MNEKDLSKDRYLFITKNEPLVLTFYFLTKQIIGLLYLINILDFTIYLKERKNISSVTLILILEGRDRKFSQFN